jgi:hypothetical protein
MCAYNRFNETSACHNAGLLGSNGLLRMNGFNGTHVTCYFDLVSYHVQGMLWATGERHTMPPAITQMPD